MPPKNLEQLVDVLRATLVQVEQTSGVSPDDPALAALRNIVLQRIADLELEKASHEGEAETTPVVLSTTSDSPVAPAALPNELSQETEFLDN